MLGLDIFLLTMNWREKPEMKKIEEKLMFVKRNIKKK